MRRCIDCGVELNADNKSKHQPTIRCLACFETFAVRATETLEQMAAQLDMQDPEPPEGMELCPICKGHGDVMYAGGPNDAWGADVQTCAYCCGTGWICSFEGVTP